MLKRDSKETQSNTNPPPVQPIVPVSPEQVVLDENSGAQTPADETTQTPFRARMKEQFSRVSTPVKKAATKMSTGFDKGATAVRKTIIKGADDVKTMLQNRSGKSYDIGKAQVKQAATTMILGILFGGQLLLLAVALFMTMRTTLRVDRIFKEGRRRGEECGNEFLEAETDKYAIYEALSTKQGALGKSFLITLDLIRTGMLLSLLTPFSVAYVMLKYKPELKSGRAATMLWFGAALSLSIGSIIAWLTIWIKTLKKGEANIFYQDNLQRAHDDFKAYRKKLLATSMGIFGAFVSVLATGAYLYLRTPPERPLNKAWLKTCLQHIGIGAAMWAALLAIYSFAAKSYFNMVSNANAYYYGSLIDDASESPKLLKDVVDKLVEYNMPTTKGDMDNARAASSLPAEASGTPLERVKNEVESKLLAEFARNIRGLERAEGDDYTLVKDRRDTLWKYVMHRGGKELDDIQRVIETNRRESKDTYFTQTLDNINLLRNALRNIRQDTRVRRHVRKYVRTVCIVAAVVSAIVLFGVFHVQYQKNAGRTLLQWCGVLLVLTVLATYYGWVNSAMRL
jgi:hypothetical protein